MPLNPISDFLERYGEILVKRSEEESKWHRPQLFDISAYQYLDFAIKDLEGDDSERSRVNSLSNAKRSLHRRIDTLIQYYWLGERAKRQRWNFPKKIDVLRELGITSPDVLSKINQYRNWIEHEYVTPPAKGEIEDFIGIVELFLASTNPFLETPSELAVPSLTLSFILDLEGGVVSVRENNVKKEELQIGRESAWLDFSQLLFSERSMILKRIRDLGYVCDEQKALKEIKKEIIKQIKAKYP